MNISPPVDPALSICSPAPPGTRFDIVACYNRTRGCPFFPKMPFHECRKYCGDSFGYYDPPGIFGTLTSWVLPLFALLANMHFAESTLEGLEWRWASRHLNYRWLKWLWKITKSQLPKHFVCAVQLANPIGTIWTLAVKLDIGQQLWDHCNSESPNLNPGGRRDTANLCYCLDDFGHKNFEERVNRLIQLLKSETRIRNNEIVTNIVAGYVEATSRNLAFARVRNTRRTIFAILVYIGMAISTLLASTSSSGLDYSLPHTIALRELCFFIFAQVILSSTAGAWSQQGVPQAIMKPFAKQMYEIEEDLSDGRPDLWVNLAVNEIALWDGGSYVFPPQKSKRSIARRDGEFSCAYTNRRHQRLLAMACSIVLFAFVASFVISCSTPTKGIGGRGLAEIFYILVWTVNFSIEHWKTPEIRDDDHRKKIFMLIWLKDGIISLLVLLFFFLPFIGELYSSAVMLSITPLLLICIPRLV